MIEEIEEYLSKHNIKYSIEKGNNYIRICTDGNLRCDIEERFDPRYEKAPFLLDYEDSYIHLKNSDDVIEWLNT